jgi:hypothetical protein
MPGKKCSDKTNDIILSELKRLNKDALEFLATVRAKIEEKKEIKKLEKAG